MLCRMLFIYLDLDSFYISPTFKINKKFLHASTMNFFRILALLVGLLLGFDAAKAGYVCTAITPEPIMPHYGRRLKDHVYKNFTSETVFSCYRACEKDKLCQSANFLQNTKQCQFNRDNSGTRPESYILDFESAYLNNTSIRVPKNCGDILKWGGKTSGVYSVDPDGLGPFKVSCDMITSGGGWTVFQKRQDGSVNFYRGWSDYKTGFGNLTDEFWLGLDKIYRLTNQMRKRLRVDLEDTTGNNASAEYDYFAVSDEKNNYRLSLGIYSGNAGDSLSYQRDVIFSTKDRNNKVCAALHKGAWWYKGCHHSNLNGFYYNGTHSSFADGVNWKTWKGLNYSVKRAEMKIRPVEFNK